MEGTGVLSGNGYDDTNATWSFSAQATGSSYSMKINAVNAVTAVPAVPVSEPGVLALLGLGLMGIGATLIANLLQRHRWIGYLGLILIVYVAVKLIFQGSTEIVGVAGY